MIIDNEQLMKYKYFIPERIEYGKSSNVSEGTLILADISGFTKISEELASAGRNGTEELTSMIDKIFESLLSIVWIYDGDVLKFIGDAILVKFTNNKKARECSEELIKKNNEFKNLKSHLEHSHFLSKLS